MCRTVLMYYRAVRFSLELFKYIDRKIELIHANL